MEDYKYILTYIAGNKKVTHEFQADVDIYELAGNLRDFLCGCSWSEDNAKEVVKCELD